MKNHQRLNVGDQNLKSWLVGITDGDGTFSINYSDKEKKKILFNYSIAQHKKNERMLLYIQKKLGIGKIYKTGENMLTYRVRKREEIKKIIVPIFEECKSIHEKKRRDYLKLKESIDIMEKDITKEEKLEKIKIIKNKNNNIDKMDALNNKIIYDQWLIGFTEAEGCFRADIKTSRFTYEITQKEKEVLEKIKYKFKMKNKILYNNKGFYKLSSSNSRVIKNIIKFYEKKENKMIGIKSLEFILWKKAIYYNKKENKEEKKLKLIQILKKIQHFKFD